MTIINDSSTAGLPRFKPYRNMSTAQRKRFTAWMAWLDDPFRPFADVPLPTKEQPPAPAVWPIGYSADEVAAMIARAGDIRPHLDLTDAPSGDRSGGSVSSEIRSPTVTRKRRRRMTGAQKLRFDLWLDWLHSSHADALKEGAKLFERAQRIGRIKPCIPEQDVVLDLGRLQMEREGRAPAQSEPSLPSVWPAAYSPAELEDHLCLAAVLRGGVS